ncbi:serine hydrolase domain-containing protein [Hymenobacter aerophilus]|uniref:serine hydrolase domain-containing protein n=1 Tax=Hymenobacter aerophilus TaxID=119644 RepID=UPI0003762310|nr:serine hydrolase [Hymenobacter aerophilus]
MNVSLLLAGLLSAAPLLTAMAQTDRKYPTAAETDPLKLGWMQGSPPPAGKVLRVSDNSALQWPALRWSVVHMRQLLPTVEVSPGLGAPSPLPVALDANIDKVTFRPWNARQPMTWQASLAENYTDGMLIMHRGRVVYERYSGALTPTNVHAVMSLTKSFTGTLAAMLVAEGKLDETRLVTFYVPELQKSGFADATVRQVMDMTTGLKYSEEYADPKAEVWQFSAAGNPFKPHDYKGPDGYYAYLETVKKQGQHGEAFGYRTVNADALGWIVARAAGKSVAELLSERIWRKIGAEQAAYYQVDDLGTPFAGGGLNAGLHDLARFGELIRNEGRWNGEQVLPAAAVQDIRKGGSKGAFAKSGHPELKGWSYRNMWWMTENAHGAFAARGVYGQTVYIDPAAEMVIVRLASHPVAANAANDPTSLPAYEAVAEYLMKQK